VISLDPHSNDNILLVIISGVIIPAVSYFIWALKKKDAKLEATAKKLSEAQKELIRTKQKTNTDIGENTLENIYDTHPD
jgi:uncharacterized membrane protein (DUF106 family)